MKRVEGLGGSRVQVTAEVRDPGVHPAMEIRNEEVVVVGERAVSRDLQVLCVLLARVKKEVVESLVEGWRRSQTTALLERPPREGVRLVLDPPAFGGHAGTDACSGPRTAGLELGAGWDQKRLGVRRNGQILPISLG